MYKEYSDETEGYYNKFYGSEYIVVNSSLSRLRQIFIIAHEIGHAILHYKEKSFIIVKCTKYANNELENEANVFAFYLLKYFNL